MKILYAIPTYHCNFNCSYCDIHKADNINDNWNEDKFIKQIKDFDGHIILFGGEPFKEIDRVKLLLTNEITKNKINSISTNLVLLNTELIKLIKKNKIQIATTWEYSRFCINGELNSNFKNWLAALKKLNYKNNVSVLITLTPDLINNITAIDLLYYLGSVFNFIQDIKFEILIDPKMSKDEWDEYHKKFDMYLLYIKKLWKSEYPILKNFKELEFGKCKHNCSDVYTLRPDGIIENKCPHNFPYVLNSECLVCSKANICQPCRLQKYCVFPFKTYESLKET